jgi:hypothetical protein
LSSNPNHEAKPDCEGLNAPKQARKKYSQDDLSLRRDPSHLTEMNADESAVASSTTVVTPFEVFFLGDEHAFNDATELLVGRVDCGPSLF